MQRVSFVMYFIGIVLMTLLVRVYYLSIKSNSYYETLSQKNTIRLEYMVPVRGTISDRNGEFFAQNALGFSLEVVPHLSFKNKGDILEKNCDLIAKTFALEKEKLIATYKKEDSNYNHDEIKLIDFLPYDEVYTKGHIFSFNPYVHIVPTIRRVYPKNDVASHVIGYISKADKKNQEENPTSKITKYVGKTGIEKYYNDYLQGKEGYVKHKVTAFNEEIEDVETVQADDNKNLVLTLDMRLQSFIHDLFMEQAGAVIVMKVDGEILAAGSFPEYDLNLFLNGIQHQDWENIINDVRHPFTNKLVNGLYPPGSTIKMGVGLALLTNGVSPSDEVFCNGEFPFNGRKFRCWKEKGHGGVDFNRAIRESCDDYFYKNSLRVGIDPIANLLGRVGFGEKTGIDLPNEFYGVVPSKEWKKQKLDKQWFAGETLISAIGQGYTLATPMQLATHTALLATGKLPVPHIAKKMGEIEVKPILKDVLSDEEKAYLPLVQKGMYEVCNEPRGTATNFLYLAREKLAGKTGTAQVVTISQVEKKRINEHEMEYLQRSHAWLTVYYPFDNPKYVVTIMVEHGGHGGATTGDEVTAIVNYMKQLGY